MSGFKIRLIMLYLPFTSTENHRYSKPSIRYCPSFTTIYYISSFFYPHVSDTVCYSPPYIITLFHHHITDIIYFSPSYIRYYLYSHQHILDIIMHSPPYIINYLFFITMYQVLFRIHHKILDTFFYLSP